MGKPNTSFYAAMVSTGIGGVLLIACIPALGVHFGEAVLALLHIAVFYAIPGLALVRVIGWDNERSDLVCVWALALGITFQPIFLIPFWMVDFKIGYFIAPVLAIAYLIAQRRSIFEVTLQNCRDWRFDHQGLQVVFVAIFTLVTIYFCVADAFSLSDLDSHYVDQATTARMVWHGYPPENAFVEGVPLSYNYAAHLLMAHMTNMWSLDPVVTVARISPLFFLAILILLTFSFSITVLRLPGWSAALAVISAFWVVGYGPINCRLYGSLLAPPNVRLIGPLCALIAFMVAVRLLSEIRTATLTRHLGLAILFGCTVFSATGFRGPSGAVLVCTGGFLAILPMFQLKKPDLRAAGMTIAGVGGLYAALSIFFAYGDSISGTSFCKTSGTFIWLAERGDTFWIAKLMNSSGFSPLISGVATFAVMTLMQSSFLMPGLVHRIKRFQFSRSSVPIAALFGASIAGVFGSMLTCSDGGSHFSFIHFANLSMTLLGASGLVMLTGQRNHSSLKTRFLTWTALLICGVLAGVSLFEVIYQLNHIHRRSQLIHIFERPKLKANPDLEKLLETLTVRDRVLYLGLRDQSLLAGPFISYEFNMVADRRLLEMYSSWASGELRSNLQRRKILMAELDSEISKGVLPGHLLREIADTLSDKSKSYFLITPISLHVESDAPLSIVGQTNAYVLWRWTLESGKRGG